jgi:hypothetical protein
LFGGNTHCRVLQKGFGIFAHCTCSTETILLLLLLLATMTTMIWRDVARA